MDQDEMIVLSHAYLVRDALEEVLEGTELEVCPVVPDVKMGITEMKVTDLGNGFSFTVIVKEES